MNLDDYNTLNEIFIELGREKTEIDKLIKDNLSCIKEANVYAKTYLQSEPDEIKFFSPRNVDAMHKDEIEKLENKLSHCKEEIDALNKRKRILSTRMNRIEKILKNENDNFTVLSIQEEDRRRIARDLHDTALQNLAHLIHQIELSGLYIDDDPIRAKLELSIVNKRLKEIIDEIRNTIFDLRPMSFDDLGLDIIFERMLESINENNKYEIKSEIENVSCETNIILVTLYRVVQECLNNIDKHAEATKISFSCKTKNDICYIVISDNGKGFSQDEPLSQDGKKHFGIFGMKERIRLLGGKIRFISLPDKGTTITIKVPLNSCMN